MVCIAIYESDCCALIWACLSNDHSLQVVGASGAVMGFVGLTLADLVVNSESMLNVLLRIAVITAAAVFLIVTAVTKVWSEPSPHQTDCCQGCRLCFAIDDRLGDVS